MADDEKPLGERVDGRGFSGDDFSEQERKELRHTLHILGQEFMSPSALAKSMGLAWLSNVSKALPGFAKLTAIYALIASAAAWLLGLFPGGVP